MKNQQRIILIVEDDHALRMALATKLRTDGYKVLEAKDGQEGLAMAIAEKPDLILLDIIMPIMDGLTMVSALREDPWGKSVNVIILSNNSDNEKIANAVGSGVYEYIIKSDKSLKEVSGEVNARLNSLGLS